MYELCLVTDEKLCLGRSLFDVVLEAAKGGVTLVQLREKDLNTRDFIKKALKIKEILEPFNIPLIINDRVDIALAVGADGVHTGRQDMPFYLLKKIIPAGMITGLTIETAEQAVEAEKYNTDYLGVSPVFPTSTKTGFTSHWGYFGLRKLRALSKHRLMAIGGIHAGNAAAVMEAGADGIAVVSAICSAKFPGKSAEELLSIVKKYEPK